MQKRKYEDEPNFCVMLVHHKTKIKFCYNEIITRTEGKITYQRAKRKRQKKDIKAQMDQLPQIDINYTLEDEHQVCPYCGSRLKKVGKKLIRREFNYIPAKLEVHNIYQMTYKCRTCKKENKLYMYNTPVDRPVIPHSYATSESVILVMVDKYVN